MKSGPAHHAGKKQITVAHLQQGLDEAACHNAFGDNVFRNFYVAEKIESLPEQTTTDAFESSALTRFLVAKNHIATGFIELAVKLGQHRR